MKHDSNMTPGSSCAEFSAGPPQGKSAPYEGTFRYLSANGKVTSVGDSVFSPGHLTEKCALPGGSTAHKAAGVGALSS